MSETPVLCDVDARGIATVRLNDPRRHNVLSLVMQEALARTLNELDADSAVRVVVLAGVGGKAFSAGGEISQLPDHDSDDEARNTFASAIGHLWQALDTFSKPIIANVDGYCLGGGMLLALKADIRMCSEDSSFGIPATRLGVGLNIDSVESITRVMGPSWAAEVLFSARRLNANEALRSGLVSRVETAVLLNAATDDVAAAIAANSPVAIRACKAALRESRKAHAERNVELVEDLAQVCLESADYIEGKRAFAERRQPIFNGGNETSTSR